MPVFCRQAKNRRKCPMGKRPRRKRKPMAQFVEEVRAAFIKKASSPKARNGRHPNSLANLKPRGRPNLHIIRRKCAGLRSDGKPCNAPALKGATHCQSHGGRRQAPAHPGNLKRLADGRLDMWAESEAASLEWRKAPYAAQRAVREAEAVPPPPGFHCSALRTINRAKGVRAYLSDRGAAPGAWARWIRGQDAIQRAFEAQPTPTYWDGTENPHRINRRKGK